MLNYALHRAPDSHLGHDHYTVHRLATPSPCGPTQGYTVNHAQLSDVQIANLTLLLTIRYARLTTRPATCYQFALDVTQAARLAALSIRDHGHRRQRRRRHVVPAATRPAGVARSAAAAGDDRLAAVHSARHLVVLTR